MACRNSTTRAASCRSPPSRRPWAAGAAGNNRPTQPARSIVVVAPLSAVLRLDAFPAGDHGAIDEDVIDDGQADPGRIPGIAAGTGCGRRIGAFVEDQGDALDAASGGNDRKRLRWVRGLETYARPLRGVLRRGRRRRVVGAAADEREGVAAALKRIGHVEPRCTRTAMAAVAVVVAELEVC